MGKQYGQGLSTALLTMSYCARTFFMRVELLLRQVSHTFIVANSVYHNLYQNDTITQSVACNFTLYTTLCHIQRALLFTRCLYQGIVSELRLLRR